MRWEKERDRYHGNAPCELVFKVAFWEEEYCLAHCTVAEANTLPPWRCFFSWDWLKMTEVLCAKCGLVPERTQHGLFSSFTHV